MLTGLRRSAFFLAVAIASADLHAAGVRPVTHSERRSEFRIG